MGGDCDGWYPLPNIDTTQSGGGYDFINIDEVVYNMAPNFQRPTNASPAGGATGVSTTPTLTASPFSASGLSTDTQQASEWVVMNSQGTTIWDSGTDTSDTDSTTVPAGKLTANTTYSWQVRYEDSGGVWGSYSSATTFTTAGSPNTPVNASPANGATGIALRRRSAHARSAVPAPRRPASG